jgi:acetyl-CoA carboxylase biotin carboxyl carrier protein
LSEKRRKSKSKTPPDNGGGGGAAGPMDVSLLKQLVDLMTSNDLNTVDLRESGKRIILKRGATQAGSASPAPVAHLPAAASSASAPVSSSPPAAGADEDSGLVSIKSPMVGTFYAAASPDAKPFVSVGSQVVKDETDVCIIEAMKVFNNIKAEVTGTITKILVTNGQTVEFGTVLFLVRPS